MISQHVRSAFDSMTRGLVRFAPVNVLRTSRRWSLLDAGARAYRGW